MAGHLPVGAASGALAQGLPSPALFWTGLPPGVRHPQARPAPLGKRKGPAGTLTLASEGAVTLPNTIAPDCHGQLIRLC